MAKYMMDPKTNLWHHSYWVKAKKPYPRKVFWGRGNGWVIASLPMILEAIGNHQERQTIIDIYLKTSAALIGLMRKDGCFETVLNRPGKTYRELSATALIAAGWLQGYRMGLVGKEYLEAGKKAFKAVVDQLEEGETMMMPEISAPTIPLPIFPYLGYKLTPKGKNWSYGIAALIFAAIQFDAVTKS
jgi:unsaturated rhamnogalacturonyl hydrolase